MSFNDSPLFFYFLFKHTSTFVFDASMKYKNAKYPGKDDVSSYMFFLNCNSSCKTIEETSKAQRCGYGCIVF